MSQRDTEIRVLIIDSLYSQPECQLGITIITTVCYLKLKSSQNYFSTINAFLRQIYSIKM